MYFDDQKKKFHERSSAGTFLHFSALSCTFRHFSALFCSHLCKLVTALKVAYKKGIQMIEIWHRGKIGTRTDEVGAKALHEVLRESTQE